MEGTRIKSIHTRSRQSSNLGRRNGQQSSCVLSQRVEKINNLKGSSFASTKIVKEKSVK